MAGQLTIDTLRAGSGVLATQNGMTGIAKAWVSFVGSTAAIRGSYNVSSITRSSAGNYTVNFTTAMPDANYSCVASATQTSNGSVYLFINTGGAPTTSSCFVFMTQSGSGTGSQVDASIVNVSISGN